MSSSSLRLRTAQPSDGGPDNNPHSSSLSISNNDESIITTVDEMHKKRVLRTNKVTSTRTILITMLSLSTCMLLSSSRLHSRLSGRFMDHTASESSWGWEPRLRRRRSNHHQNVNDDNRAENRLHHHPRVISNIDHLLPISIVTTQSSKQQSYISRILYKYFTTNPAITLDPMLHNDEWRGDYHYQTRNEASSSWWGRLLLLDYWKVWNSNNNDDNVERQEETNEEQCVPMAEWQTTSYPNCNVVHEIDMVPTTSQILSKTYSNPSSSQRRHVLTKIPKFLLANHRKQQQQQHSQSEEELTFLGQGWFRSAWKMDHDISWGEWDDEEDEWVFRESVVLKTLRIEREFLEEYYELHRRDALAMERLTFSPYVLNIYGYCGQSAINELANFGIEGLASLEKIARQFRGVSVEPVNKIKLQLASMVAAGVSHMHSIDYPDHVPGKENMESSRRRRSNATLVHYDLNPRNIAIVKRGKPKLNDFNVAEFLSWDTKHNTTCGFKGRFREPWWRAPEEMHYHDPAYNKHPIAPLTEKVDIYSLGNILHTLLTSHSPRGKMSKELMEEIRPKVARGELPKIPSDFNETEAEADPALSPIMKAMYKCLKALPEDRPSAGEIAEELELAVDNLPEDYGDKEKFYNSEERERMREKLKAKKSKSKKHHD